MKLPDISGRILASLILAALLASCTAIAPPREWAGDRSVERGADTAPPTPSPAPPKERERKRLSWDQALRIAMERSPTIAAARERIARAEALVREARARALPRLDARASVVRFIEAADFRGRTGSDVSGSSTRTRFFTGRGSDIYNGGVDASYPLFDGGEVYYATQAARADAAAARHEAMTVQRDLELSVSAAFLNVLLSNGAIRIAEDTLEFTRAQEERARARQQAGEGLEVDTLRFSTSASQEQLELNRARAARKTRVAILVELLATPLAEDIELVEPTADLNLPEEELQELAYSRRSELKALAQRARAVASRLEQEHSSWWPDVDLFASYGALSLDNLKLSDRKDEFQVGGSLSVPLFEGGASSARAAALRRELAEVRSQAEEARLAIERQLLQSRIDLDLATQNVAVSEETVNLSEEVLDRVSAQYRVGEAQVLDVTEATLQRTQARLALLRSQINALLAQASLRRAVGLDIAPESAAGPASDDADRPTRSTPDADAEATPATEPSTDREPS